MAGLGLAEAEQVREISEQKVRCDLNILHICLAAPLIVVGPTAASPETLDGAILYCEATRFSDGQKVRYFIEFRGGSAEINGYKWHVKETDDRIILDFYKANGWAKDTKITIDRRDGHLLHVAMGGISIYRTLEGDRPCEVHEHRF